MREDGHPACSSGSPLIRLLILTLVLAIPVLCEAASGDQLERVVLLSRHSVRAPMASAADLGRSSAGPWPDFAVPRGHLTANGRLLEGLLGDYYRQLYQMLLSARQCDALYVWANDVERTIETGRALAHALQPDCPVVIHTIGDGRADPLFDAVGAGIAHPDYDLALASVAGRIGGNPAAWAQIHRADLQALEDLLGHGEQSLSTLPSRLGRGEGSKLVQVEGPFARASSLSESLLMAYADGLSLDKLGNGAISEDRLRDAQAAHALDLDMQLRAPYIAQITSSYLASRLLATLQGRPDGVGEGKTPLVALIGHDGTIEQLGGLLDLHWLLSGYQPDQVPPGGALRFELWKRGDGREVVRLSFTAQSLPQLRDSLPLSLDQPPLTAPVFIPGCSEATPAYDCPLELFASRLGAVIDPNSIAKL
jgi:4-phytase/acid phosphatase